DRVLGSGGEMGRAKACNVTHALRVLDAIRNHLGPRISSAAEAHDELGILSPVKPLPNLAAISRGKDEGGKKRSHQSDCCEERSRAEVSPGPGNAEDAQDEKQSDLRPSAPC